MNKKLIVYFIVSAIFCVFISDSLLAQAQYLLDWKLHNVGKVRQVVTNQGTMNKAWTKYPGLIMAEFPPGSDEEHVFQGGIWVGAINPNGDTLVSETQSHNYCEFFPGNSPADLIFTAKKGDTLHIPWWDPYIGISDQDFICRYNDYNKLDISNHKPLYVDIIQTSHAWSSPPVDEFVLFQYYIMPTRVNLKNAYIAFWLHGSCGNVNVATNFIDEYTKYFAEYHMGVDEDDPEGDDGRTISPVGFSVLEVSEPVSKWTFKYYEHENMPVRDGAEYREMSSGTIMPNRYETARAHIIVAFGPFDLNVGDTLKVVMGEVFGYGIKGLLANAKYLQYLQEKGFRLPSPPPSPKVTARISSKQVILDWTPPLDSASNPEQYTDQYRGDGIKKPFEGYRIYRSTKSLDGPWTLLGDYDKAGDDIGYNTGLQYTYTDDGLMNYVEYYYAVTAYSMPDKSVNFPSQESSISANAITIVPGTDPPQTVGKVTVIPNPYRGDIAYTSYIPPWEKPQKGRQWMEQDRRILFNNLPEKCEIKIYTLAGDLVYTMYHENTIQGYEAWNLTSSVGQAVASGIYLFSVEDKKNGQVQVGKFVIIK